MARISVIISTFNRKDLLKKAIKSVLAQSHTDFECIVVDDCSTQDNETLVASFGDPRLSYMRTEKNSGHDALPKNLGIKAATGDYVSFLDDDDTYRVDALKILSTYLEETKVDVVYGDYLIDGKPGWSEDFSPAKLREFNYIPMCSVLVRRASLLAVGGFDEEVPKFKDWNLWLRLQKYGASFMHIPIIVFEIHQTPNSISASVAEEKDEFGRYKPTYFNPSDCYIYPNKTSLGTRKPLRVALYTLTMDRLEYTKRMAASIDKLAGYPFDWFVIDQGSTDGTQEWLKTLPTPQYVAPAAGEDRKNWRVELQYRLYEQNMGLAKGWNNALAWIKDTSLKDNVPYDVLVKVDNDAEMLTDGWLKAMVEIFERNRKVVLSPYVEGLENTPGGVLRQRASGDSPYLMINDRVLGLVPHLGGIVYACPSELVADWKFDEEAVGNKDTVLSGYAQRQGLALFYMEEFRVAHIDGTSGQRRKFPDYFNADELKKVKATVLED